MIANFNLFLENIVQNKKLSFETDSDKEREELLTQKRELGFAKCAIRFVFGIMKTEKEPSSNSTLM